MNGRKGSWQTHVCQSTYCLNDVVKVYNSGVRQKKVLMRMKTKDYEKINPCRKENQRRSQPRLKNYRTSSICYETKKIFDGSNE